MRKLAVVLLGVVLSLGIMLDVSLAADLKLASIDLRRVFSEYQKTKEYDKVLGEKEGAFNSEREKKVNEIKQFQEKLNLLSEQEKEAKKSELEKKVKEIQDYDREKGADLRKEQDEKMKDILKDIEAAVKKYSEKEGITLVLNEGVLVYQDKSLDITEKIIEILNK